MSEAQELSEEGVARTLGQSDRRDKPAVGIVCNPSELERLRKAARDFAPRAGMNPSSLFNGIPVFAKARQIVPFLAFYDEEALRKYLAEA